MQRIELGEHVSGRRHRSQADEEVREAPSKPCGNHSAKQASKYPSGRANDLGSRFAFGIRFRDRFAFLYSLLIDLIGPGDQPVSVRGRADHGNGTQANPQDGAI